MATITHLEIPAEEFALAETLATCAGATVECERLVATPSETVMPLVWVRSAGTVEAAFDDDPTVGSYTQLAGTDTELLYEMDWHANIRLVLRILTTEGAVILNAQGNEEGWYLQVLFPDRAEVRTTIEFCETRNLTLTMHSIRQLDGADPTQGSIRAGLTTEQHEALFHAYERGYFDVPRTANLDAVANDLGVSHQALSERLRRGHATLIGETLGNGAEPASLPQQAAGDTARSADSDRESVDD